jgi:hypothetical protein
VLIVIVRVPERGSPEVGGMPVSLTVGPVCWAIHSQLPVVASLAGFGSDLNAPVSQKVPRMIRLSATNAPMPAWIWRFFRAAAA